MGEIEITDCAHRLRHDFRLLQQISPVDTLSAGEIRLFSLG
jgi:hypothetical protein